MDDYGSYDLFDKPRYSNDVDDYDELFFYPNHLEGNSTGPYEILVAGNGVQFLQLNRARLEVSLEYSVIDANTEAVVKLAPKHDASCIPFLGNTLFRTLRFKIANMEVPELTQSLYDYKSYVEELLNNTQENEQVYMRAQLGTLDYPGTYTKTRFWKDFGSYAANASKVTPSYDEVVIGTAPNTQTLLSPDPYEVKKNGIWKRKDLIEDNNPIFLSVPLHVDFLNQQKYFPPNFSMSFIFERNTDAFVTLSQMGTAATPKITIRKMKMVVPVVSLHPDLSTKIFGSWNSNPIPYYYQYVVPRTFHLAQGSMFWEDNDISHGVLPKSVYFVFVQADHFNGVHEYSPFVFSHLNISKFELTLGGQVLNKCTLEPDFKAGSDGLRAYSHFLKHAKKEREDCLITTYKYKEDYTIYPFDLSNDFNNNYNLYEPKFGTLGVRVKFPALTRNYVAIAFFVYTKVLEIDKHLQAVVKDI